MAGSLVPRSSFGDTLAKLGETIADQQYRREARDILGQNIDALVQPQGGGLSALGSPAQSSLPSFARVQGGSPSPTIAGILDDTSKKYGLDPGFLPRLAMIESGGNPNAHNASGADGLLQFMPRTAQAYGLGNTRDPSASADAGARLSLDNRRTLAQTLNREPTQGELYLGHQQGAGGAAKLLANPQARAADIVGLKAVVQNGGTPDMTAEQFARKWTSRFPDAPAVAGGAPTAWSSGDGAFVPGSVASPAIGGPSMGASPSAPAQAQPRLTPQRAAQLKAMLANPYTAQAAQAEIAKLTTPEEFGFQTVGDQLYRTSKRGGVEAVGIQKAPTYQSVKADDGSTLTFNPQTGQYHRAIPGKDNSVRTITDPSEREAIGLGAYTGVVQEDADGRIILPGKAATEVKIDQATEKTYDTKVGGAYGETFTGLQQGGRAAAGQLNTLRIMEKLVENPNFYSGTGANTLLAFRRAANALGIADADKAAPTELFTKLASQSVLDKLGGSLGSGVSNADVAFITQTTANLQNTPEGNRQIIQFGKALAQRQIDVAKRARDYAKAHNGRIDAGFDDDLAQWAAQNPLFPEATALQQAAPAPAAPAAPPPVSPTGYDRAALEAEARRRGLIK